MDGVPECFEGEDRGSGKQSRRDIDWSIDWLIAVIDWLVAVGRSTLLVGAAGCPPLSLSDGGGDASDVDAAVPSWLLAGTYSGHAFGVKGFVCVRPRLGVTRPLHHALPALLAVAAGDVLLFSIKPNFRTKPRRLPTLTLTPLYNTHTHREPNERRHPHHVAHAATTQPPAGRRNAHRLTRAWIGPCDARAACPQP
jgi:hypothetical protein